MHEGHHPPQDNILGVVLCNAGLEEHAIGCSGLCLEGGDSERVVLREEVVGSLAEVLVGWWDGAVAVVVILRDVVHAGTVGLAGRRKA